MSKKHKARSKVTQKLTRNGAVRRDEVTKAEERISGRTADFNLRGTSPDERTLSQFDTRPGRGKSGRKSSRSKSRAAYNRQPNHEAEYNQNAEIPHSDAFGAGEQPEIVREHGTEPRPPDVKSKPPPEPAQAAPQPRAAAKPREPIKKTAETFGVPENQTVPVPKLKTERESKLNTDVNSVLRFERDNPSAQGKSKHGKRRYDKLKQETPQPQQSQPITETAQPPASETQTVSNAADAEPDNQPQKPSEQRVSDEADTPDTAPADSGASSAKPHSPLKEPESALKQGGDSKLKFSPDDMPPETVTPSRKLAKAQKQAEKATRKLETAKSRLPAKKKLRTKIVTNEETGKSKRKLYFDSEVKSQGEHLKGPLPLRPVKAAGNSALAFGHRKMFQVERENVATEASHKAEMAVEGGVRIALRRRKTAPYRKVEKLQRKATKKSVNLAYQKALADNLPDGLRPKLKSSFLSRAFQKRKIKRDYAKKAREAQKAAKNVKKAGGLIADAGKAIVNIAARHPVGTAVVALIILLLFSLMSLIGAFGSMGSGGLGGILSASYLAEDEDIDNAELAYTEWETDLMAQIADAESSYSGYDEYRYNVGDVSHNPYELMAYLTVKYQNFSYTAVQSDLWALFEEQYALSFTPTTETRYRAETGTDPETGEPTETLVPYDWHVMTVTLTARNFSEVTASRLSGDELVHYAVLLETKGSRQYLANPVGELNWIPFVTSWYGYRIHPISGAADIHRGIDIALPLGTEIHSGQDGIVTFAGWSDSYGNVVVIEGDKGLTSKYAHCDSFSVTTGQDIKTGDIIGKVGSTGNSTGAHLHLEILKNGEYLNPAFFADTGSFNLTPVYGNAGTPMGDGSYAALIAEAETHLGKPYIFGANGPSAFDCSSYVSTVLTNSGVKNTGRLTAYGLYQICAPVSPSEAMPGDLVFWTGTYSTASPVTHVAIYVGKVNGRDCVIHAGSPVQYAYIDTPYWQRHFYAFGRIN